eukprot:scaffold544_cov117-Isochrysis_galbana.AAC.1
MTAPPRYDGLTAPHAQHRTGTCGVTCCKGGGEHGREGGERQGLHGAVGGVWTVVARGPA